MKLSDIRNRFDYHRPRTEEAADKCGDVREVAGQLALILNDVLPDSREKSTAITKLEEVMMWGIAAIVRNQGDEADA